jgi:hypothetical protein
MSRESELTIGVALVIAMGCGVSNAAAQTDKYPRMAAIGQYLMEKNAEIYWREVPLPTPYPATRRSWFWDGRDMREPLKARTGLSAWWQEVGWLRSTGPNSGTRR